MGTPRKTVEAQKPQELNARTKACRHPPTFERHGHPLKSRIVFAFEGSISHLCKNQDEDGDQRGPYMAVGGGRHDNGRRHIPQAEDKNPRLNQARPPTLRGNSGAGRSSSWQNGETTERGSPEGRERKRKGSDGSDGSDARWRQQIERSVAKLLIRWRDRRDCVSEPPISRNERESELVASLINVTRQFDEFSGSFFSCLRVLLLINSFSFTRLSGTSTSARMKFFFGFRRLFAVLWPLLVLEDVLFLNADRHKCFFFFLLSRHC